MLQPCTLTNSFPMRYRPPKGTKSWKGLLHLNWQKVGDYTKGYVLESRNFEGAIALHSITYVILAVDIVKVDASVW